MLTRGSAFSLSRIRVSADAMEMEMAMTADGAAAPTCWLRDSCRCFHGGSTVFSGAVARRGGVANKEEELATRCKCSGGVECCCHGCAEARTKRCVAGADARWPSALLREGRDARGAYGREKKMVADEVGAVEMEVEDGWWLPAWCSGVR